MTKLDDYQQVAEGYPLPETMKAVVLTGNYEGDLNLARVRVPECAGSQLLGSVDAAVACASDNKLVDQCSDHPLMYRWDVSKHSVVIGREGTVTILRSTKVPV